MTAEPSFDREMNKPLPAGVVDTRIADCTEQKRLNEAREAGVPWKKWGPYLSERQWGTVREDYSQDGNAWDYFSHDQSRSRAYRWGEDGLGGISDDRQRLCFALALWNERDAILKERLFGLTNSEGNHGFTWILGLGLAFALGIINVMWLESTYFSGELDKDRGRERLQRGERPID